VENDAASAEASYHRVRPSLDNHSFFRGAAAPTEELHVQHYINVASLGSSLLGNPQPARNHNRPVLLAGFAHILQRQLQR
jgi:hypothetical protein